MQRSRRNKIANRTPMTIPAIAPPLRPLFVVVEATPAAVPLAAAAVPVGDGVMNATVVVAEPIEVAVVATLLVGLSGATLVVAVTAGLFCSNSELLLSAPLPLLAAH